MPSILVKLNWGSVDCDTGDMLLQHRDEEFSFFINEITPDIRAAIDDVTQYTRSPELKGAIDEWMDTTIKALESRAVRDYHFGRLIKNRRKSLDVEVSKISTPTLN